MAATISPRKESGKVRRATGCEAIHAPQRFARFAERGKVGAAQKSRGKRILGTDRLGHFCSIAAALAIPVAHSPPPASVGSSINGAVLSYTFSFGISIAPVRLVTCSTPLLRHHASSPWASRSVARGSA